MFADTVGALIGLPDQLLDDDLRRLELEHRQYDSELIAGILVAENRCLHARDGHRSMNGYLRATFNWSTAEAGRWRAQAHAVGAINGLGDALAAGRIGAPQVALFAKAHSNKRVRDALDRLAPTLLRHAEELSYKDFGAVMSHAMSFADPDGADQDQRDAVEGRKATVTDIDGSLYLRATGGDALATTELIAIIDRFVELEFKKDADARRAVHGDDTAGIPLGRSDAQRRHDAIHTAFHLANNALDADLPEGVQSEPLVNIVVDDDTFARMLDKYGLAVGTDLGDDPVDPFTGLTSTMDPLDLLAELLEDPDELLNRRCETTNGVRLSPRHLLQAMLAGHVRRVVVGSRNHVIDFGRKHRLFTGAARDAALLLLRTCQHPGCELRAEWCQVDHGIEWGDMGTTDQANSGPECAAHNRAKHRNRWKTRIGVST